MNQKQLRLWSLILVFATLPSLALASQMAGTLTNLEGTVQVFHHPMKKPEGPSPRALFEGEYYSVKTAAAGDRIEQGNILRTAPGAKARVVYDNGDQLNVGSASSYRVFWKKESANAAEAKPQINLMYGKLRGVIIPGGPRSALDVKTKTATMGVRGTDFFIADDGVAGTEVSVLRGKVKVEAKPELAFGENKSLKEEKAKPIEVTSGQSAIVEKPADLTKKTEAVIRPTTQEELSAIQRSSTVNTTAQTEVKEELKKQIEKLETKAKEGTLKDIKKTQPELYAKLSADKGVTASEMNNQVAESLVKSAPKAPKERKPYRSELEDLEGDAYKKYFKSVD